MPIYEYRCKTCGKVYEQIRRASEALELFWAVLLLPIFVVGAAVWHTGRSAAIHAFQRSCHIAFSPSRHPAAV